MNNSLFAILLLMALGTGTCVGDNCPEPNSCDPLSLALCCMLFSSCVGARYTPLAFTCGNNTTSATV